MAGFNPCDCQRYGSREVTTWHQASFRHLTEALKGAQTGQLSQRAETHSLPGWTGCDGTGELGFTL